MLQVCESCDDFILLWLLGSLLVLEPQFKCPPLLREFGHLLILLFEYVELQNPRQSDALEISTHYFSTASLLVEQGSQVEQPVGIYRYK